MQPCIVFQNTSIVKRNSFFINASLNLIQQSGRFCYLIKDLEKYIWENIQAEDVGH